MDQLHSNLREWYGAAPMVYYTICLYLPANTPTDADDHQYSLRDLSATIAGQYDIGTPTVPGAHPLDDKENLWRSGSERDATNPLAANLGGSLPHLTHFALPQAMHTLTGTRASSVRPIEAVSK
ncbi:hypothetical protein ACG7TL_003486 [Trametes sanguinea]